MILTINDTFKELIPALTTQEYTALQASILDEGCRDAIVHWQGVIVDGHNRYAICQQHNIPFNTIERDFESEAHAKVWIIKNQNARRNLTPAQRDVLALALRDELKIIAHQNKVRAGELYGENHPKQEVLQNSVKPLEPIDSTREAAAEFNTSHDSMRKTKAVLEEGDEETKAALLAGEISRNEAYSKVKKLKKKRQRKQQRECEIIDVNPMIRIGDMHLLGDEIEDNSIDLIFTDPPYGNEHIVDYEALAILGSRVLKPGASLLCYCGQSVLPKVLEVMIPHLNYHWMISMVHSGATQRFPGKWVFIGWKPILWFTKGTRRDEEFVTDTILSKPDKQHHEWGQGIEEALYYIEHLTYPGEIVFDPFCGGGTTCLAAKKLNRSYLAFEIDPKTASIAIERVSNDT